MEYYDGPAIRRTVANAAAADYRWSEQIPTRDVDLPRMTRFPAPSAYWGDEVGLFDGVAQARSSAMDHRGRV